MKYWYSEIYYSRTLGTRQCDGDLEKIQTHQNMRRNYLYTLYRPVSYGIKKNLCMIFSFSVYE